MEATFCLRTAAASVPSSSRQLHAAAARSSHLRPCVCSVFFSHAALPPRVDDNGGRRKVVPTAGTAMVVACAAVGALDLSVPPRGARAVGAGSVARSSTSIAASMGDPPGAPGGMDDGLEIRIQYFGAKTPLLLAKMLLPEPQLPGEAKQPSAVLLQHFYSNVLSPKMQLELMELLYHLGQELSDEKRIDELTKSPVTRHGWLPALERTETALALAQIYFDSKHYEKTREMMSQLIDPKTKEPILPSDARIPVIQAITYMMLVLEEELHTVPEGKNSEEEEKKRSDKVLSLIADAQKKWKYYKELVEIFPLSAPPQLTSDDDPIN